MIDPDLIALLESNDCEVRRQAVADVPTEQVGDATEMILLALGDGDWRVRKEALHRLSQAGFAAQVAARLLETFRTSDNVGLRNAAVEALGAMGPDVVPVLRRDLSHHDADGRKLVAEALGKTQALTALGPLETLAADDDPNVRIAAIEAVGAIGGSYPEAALELLERALDKDDDVFLQLAALEGMGQIGAFPPWKRLAPLADLPVLHRKVMELAAFFEEPEVATRLARELSSVSDYMTAGVAMAFASYCEQSPQTRQATRSALSGSPPHTAERLLALVRSSDPAEAGAALTLLSMLGHPQLPLLASELLEDVHLGGIAYEALAEAGAKALAVLIERVLADDGEARAVSLELLGKLGTDPDCRPEVARVLTRLTITAETRTVRAWLSAVANVSDPALFVLATTWLDTATASAVRRAALATADRFVQSFPEQARAHAIMQTKLVPTPAFCVLYCSLGTARLLESLEADLQFVCRAVSSPSTGTRIAAMETLGALSSLCPPELLETLSEVIGFAFNDEVPGVQLAAVNAMASLHSPEMQPVGTQRLIDLARAQGETLLGITAVRAIGKGASPTALPILAEFSSDRSPSLAVAALDALSRYPEMARIAVAKKALRHPDPEVVKAALQLLPANSDGDEELLACLRHEAWDVRRLVADLIRPGSARARQALTDQFLHETEPAVRDSIRQSLSRFDSALPPPPDSTPAGSLG